MPNIRSNRLLPIARAAALTLGCLVLGCSKGPAEAGKFEDFISLIPRDTAKNCKKENDGKLYSLDGFLHLANNTTLEDGKTRLDFYPENDAGGAGKGHALSVKVKLGGFLGKGDIDDLWSAAKNVQTAGYRRRAGEIDESALRIHLADGTSAGATDKIQLTFALEPVPNIHQNMPLVCEHVFTSATKL